MFYVTSLDKRTMWSIVDGRLHEQNSVDVTFTLSACDSYIKALFLSQHLDEIKRAAIKEAGSEQNLNAILGNVESVKQLLPE